MSHSLHSALIVKQIAYILVLNYFHHIIEIQSRGSHKDHIQATVLKYKQIIESLAVSSDMSERLRL